VDGPLTASMCWRKQLRRSQVLALFAKLPPTKVGLEACGGAHYWARELIALGHEVVLSAAAICEAVRQARQETMRPMPRRSARR